jgi:predicted ATPase/class 3 adenylate cyclase
MVAFLFTDIEGSTRRWEAHQQVMWDAVERHFALLRSAISAHHGVLFKTVGDAVQAAFPTVPDAIAAAIDGQSALHQADWGNLGPLRVRMAIHVGEATPRDGDYLAPALNRLARVLATGYGDQVLLTEAALAAAGPALGAEFGALDLGAHRLRDLLQAEHIYQLRGPGLAAEFPALKSLDRHIHNLPAQPTALLGRESELAAARELLQQNGVRLLTLTGPGGTGKTRLGIQIGAELLETFPDGVWFVPLAAITDSDLVVPAIAQPLGVRENPDEPLLKTLQAYLQPRQALLLLDNFEQVATAAPDVAALLASCPKLKILVTSREPLRIAVEREFAVPPLSLPTARQVKHLSPAELLEYSAIQLFVERAQGVKPDFALSETNAADVAAICLRLDGLPLAIELAAARVRVLPPAQLLARLDKRLKLLTGGNRDLPARQQTLRAAIEWSHDLLSSDDQTLFARLSVFAGGCTLEAAEAVCGEVGDAAVDVLDGVESLTQKSLLRQQDDSEGNPRFTMFETIREFGVERLDASREADAVRHAHAEFFLALAEQAEPELRGPAQVTWLNRLAAEHDNLRASLRSLSQPADTDRRLRLAGSLWRFWWTRGHLSEGRGWLDQSLSCYESAASVALANALNGAGVLAESQGDYAEATARHEAALGIWRQIGDQIGVASSLTNLGIIARVLGEYQRAAELHQEAFTISTRLKDERGIGVSLYELGSLALYQGEYAKAANLLGQSSERLGSIGEAPALGAVFEALGILEFYRKDYARAANFYEQGLNLWREIYDSRMVAHSLVNLGEAKQYQGDLASAESLYGEAIVLFRELSEKRGIGFALAQLAKVALARDDFPQASSLFAESLVLRQQIGEKSAVIESLEGLAEVALGRGGLAERARLLGAAAALRTDIGVPLPDSYREELELLVERLRNTMGQPAFYQEWQNGQRLQLDQAIAEALSMSPSPGTLAARTKVLSPIS